MNRTELKLYLARYLDIEIYLFYFIYIDYRNITIEI